MKARADMESADPLRQSLQAASMKMPAGLSASSEVGTTRVAMMGDQSLCKARGEVNTGKVFSGRQCERRAGDLLVQASGAVRLVVT